MSNIEQRSEQIMVQLGLSAPSIKQIFREHLGEISRQAYEAGKKRGMYEQECLHWGQLPGWTEDLFEEWLTTVK